MDTVKDNGLGGEKFEIKLEDGTLKQATLAAIIESEERKIKYVYYALADDDNDTSDAANVSIYASKIVEKNGKDVVVNLDDEDERQYAYKLFSETYKTLRNDNK